MPQNPLGGKPPLGIVYNTSMTRPDAALALAALYVSERKSEAHVDAVCVVGAGLKAAIFCDMVAHFYQGRGPRSSNSSLPVGLAAGNPLPPDPPMVNFAVERKTELGTSWYAHTVNRLTDTSQAEAMMRNGVTFSADAAVVLSAPATSLARTLDLQGVRDLYSDRVKRLVIVNSGEPQRDVAAIRRIVAEWPTPVVYCGKEVGDALLFPGAALDQYFSWIVTNPVADAYRAFRHMPYDAPLYDLAAMHYAVHPDSGLFQLSEPGALSIADNGAMKFTTAGGKVRALSIDSAKRDEIVQALTAAATAKPPVPPPRTRPSK